tara:strand:- start:208 stop:399 length:192 start_codon:yes stop_codon:yes gene_type:complete
VEATSIAWLNTGAFGSIQGVDGMPANAAALLFYFLYYLLGRVILAVVLAMIINVTKFIGKSRN